MIAYRSFTIAAFSLTLWLMSEGACAFQIHPTILSSTDPVHEDITWSAVICMTMQVDGAKPKKCLNSLSGLRSSAEVSDEQITLGSLGKVNKDALLQAVWWPDDPSRGIRGIGVFASAGTFLSRCGDASGEIARGMLCASHLGPLQFFHAMAATENESPKETKGKILEWAKFAYRVARGRPKSSDQLPNSDEGIGLDVAYCGHFDKLLKQPRNDNELSFVQAMLPLPTHRPKICTSTARRERWTMETFFGWNCSGNVLNVLTHGACPLVHDDEEGTIKRLSALGAVLHLVQDSYSSAHVNRGPCNDGSVSCDRQRPAPNVWCDPLTSYYAYQGQDHDKHKVSDGKPDYQKSCFPPDEVEAEVDDPVTATAYVLWLFQQGASSEDLETYLDKHVFVHLSQINAKPQEQDIDRVGACYHGEAGKSQMTILSDRYGRQ
jgi:hypothetical protein